MQVNLGTFGDVVAFVLDAVRLLTIEPIHHATGITPATWSYAQLDESKFPQFEGIVESHFRFHQFYGNLVVAVVIGGLIRLARLGRACWPPGKVAVLMSVVALVCWFGSRTELRASYDAIAELLGPR